MKSKFSFLITMLAVLVSLLPQVASADTSIKTGDYIRLGTYDGKPVIWRCVGMDDNGLLMLSNDILCYKSYDASGEHHNNRRNGYGSNLWAESNIRCWLNSDKSEVEYICGNVPNAENTWLGINSYDKESGFLTNFSATEKQAIKSVKLKTPLNEVDTALSDGTYSSIIYDVDMNTNDINTQFQYTTDKLFLLDCEQLNIAKNTLNDDFYKSADVVSMGDNYSDSSENYSYFLRVPKSNNPSDACSVLTIETRNDFQPVGFADAYMSVGIRPAFYLNENIEFISGSGTISSPYVISDEIINNYSSDDTEKTLIVQNVNGTIRVFNKKEEIPFVDAKPFIDENGRTQIPIRAIAESLNYDVQYDDLTKTVTINSDDKSISLVIGNNIMECNDTIIEMDTIAAIVNDRTYIPVRFVGEALGYTVNYTEPVTGITLNHGKAEIMTESGAYNDIIDTH